MRAPAIEIVAIGNELLIGKTLDTNSHWLAKQITRIGGELRQVTTVRDKHGDIARAVGCAISRRPDFLLTLGGLGPTHDDITLSSISKLLGRRLVLNRAALDFLRRRYVERFGPKVKLTPPRLKMARFPGGAVPLRNPIGTAPAPCLRIGRVTMIALPGVPNEMRAIFKQSVAPMIERFGGSRRFHDRSLILLGIPESALSPVIDQVMAKNESVYIKSHPRGIEKTGRARIELHFQVTATSEKKAKVQLGQAVTMTKRKLRGRAIVRDIRGG
jgi:molybdenum cofactor synthesis domain-containing protein